MSTSLNLEPSAMTPLGLSIRRDTLCLSTRFHHFSFNQNSALRLACRARFRLHPRPLEVTDPNEYCDTNDGILWFDFFNLSRSTWLASLFSVSRFPARLDRYPVPFSFLVPSGSLTIPNWVLIDLCFDCLRSCSIPLLLLQPVLLARHLNPRLFRSST